MDTWVKRCKETYLGKKTFTEVLRELSVQYKGKIALTEGEHQISYEQLETYSKLLAQYFLERGLKYKDKIILQLPSVYTFPIVCFALFRIGVIPALVLPAYRDVEIEGIIEKLKPRMYISTRNYLGYDYQKLISRMKEKYDCLEESLYSDEIDTILLRSLDSIALEETEQIKETGIREESGGMKLEAENEMWPQSDDIAFFILSGGTTGTPKLISKTHAEYLYLSKKVAQRCNITTETAMLIVSPAAHHFALGLPGIFGTLQLGGRVVLCSVPDPSNIMEIIEQEQVNVMSVVPTMLGICLKELEWEEDYDYASLQAIICAGELLNKEIAKAAIEAFECDLYCAYGSSEGMSTEIDSVHAPLEVVLKEHGKPVSKGDEYLIVDKNGEPVKDGEVGELLCRGPYTIEAYYDLPDVSDMAFTKEGYFRTGDKAKVTKLGNIQIMGRVRDMINRAGEKIFPNEIESYIAKYPKVAEVCVMGVPDEVLGNRICAFIVAADPVCEEGLEEEKIRKFLAKKKMATFKMPDQILFVTQIPRTKVGKVDKKALALSIGQLRIF